MDPNNYRLSKEFLQEMLENSDKKDFETIFDNSKDDLSIQDEISRAIDLPFITHLSEPMKKMNIDYLQNVVKNCY